MNVVISLRKPLEILTARGLTSAGILLALVFQFSFFSLSGQSFNPREPERYLDSLSSDTARVVTINDNFYAIYSAGFERASRLTKWAVETSAVNGWTLTEYYSRMYHGVILYLTADYSSALENYWIAYQGFDSLEHLKGKAMVANEMAVTYHKQDDFESALEFLDVSEEIAIEGEHLSVLAKSYGIRATLYWLRKRYEESKPYYLKNYEINIQLQDSVGIGYALLDIADIERREGKLEEALKYVDQSIELRKAINDDQGIIESLAAKAYMYFEEGLFRQAINYSEQVEKLSMEMGYTDQQRKAQKMIANASASLNDFGMAYQFEKQSNMLKDSLFNIERSNTIEDLKTKYETEVKERQIADQEVAIAQQSLELQRNRLFIAFLVMALLVLLFAGIIIRTRLKRKRERDVLSERKKAQEQRLEAIVDSQEKERSRFARDLHDTFGQMISVLNLNVQNLSKIEKHNLEERDEVFKASSKVLDDMYNELKNACFDLMPQSLVKYGLKEALEELTNRITQTHKLAVELDLFGLEKRLPELLEISIYRLTQEWTNNVLKYSDADLITVQVGRYNDELSLIIEDNGIGFDSNLLKEGQGNG